MSNIPSIDILIPTYNRADFLRKNLLLLNEKIVENRLLNQFRLIVSDNCSPDNTLDVLGEISKSVPIELVHHTQKKNIGLEKNAIFLLNKSSADYVMYLGDDDYLPDGYLQFVVDSIGDGRISCIIPGYSSLHKDGIVKPSRNANFDIKQFEPGFETVCEISHFGHQLSGLVTRRAGLYQAYTKSNEYRNIYPFIFFVTFCMMRGATLYAPKFQVLVSQDNSKDWQYDASGLLIEIFKNYKIAFSEDEKRAAQACLSFARKQSWRLRVGRNPLIAVKALTHLLVSSEVDPRVKVSLMWLYPALYLELVGRYVSRKITIGRHA